LSNRTGEVNAEIGVNADQVGVERTLHDGSSE
jgi:hypothetical protein